MPIRCPSISSISTGRSVSASIPAGGRSIPAAASRFWDKESIIMAVTETSRPAADHRRFAPFHGVLVPALTPFGAELAVDRPAFLGFCRWLLEEGANGLAVFGTTSEANSLSLSDRRNLL